MNIEYLCNIINLYLRNEQENHRTNMSIIKNSDNLEISFNMDFENPEKTKFKFKEEIFNQNMDYILDFYKQNLVIIEEKYDYDKKNDTCYYYAKFKNGRQISFNGFSIKEVNNIRNKLYHITYKPDEIRIKFNDDLESNYDYVNNLQPSFAGFASFKTIIIIAIFILIVLIGSLIFFLT